MKTTTRPATVATAVPRVRHVESAPLFERIHQLRVSRLQRVVAQQGIPVIVEEECQLVESDIATRKDLAIEILRPDIADPVRVRLLEVEIEALQQHLYLALRPERRQMRCHLQLFPKPRRIAIRRGEELTVDYRFSHTIEHVRCCCKSETTPVSVRV